MDINDIEKETVIARLRAMPENALVSIGREFGVLSRDDMIKEVMEDSEIGKEIIEMQMAYLRSFKKR
jgi:hypothetical protein